MRVVGYVRTSANGGRGVTTEEQCAKLHAYCVARDLSLVTIEADEGASAGFLERPGLQRALTTIAIGRADALLVARLDRLTRHVVDLGLLLETYFSGSRCHLLSVTDNIDTRTAAGRLVLYILTSVAQWEREANVDD